MKKYFIYSLAALALASCGDDEFLGISHKDNPKTDGAILFSPSKRVITKADHTGSDAAGLLDNNFVVEGIKYVSASPLEVFDHYNVNWVENTSNTTTSNTKNWEYVAQSQVIKGVTTPATGILSAAQAQTIKYWDYAATQYDFVAVSLGKGVGATPTYAELSDIDYTNIGTDVVYTLTGTTQELAAAYIADLVSVYNTASHRQFNTGEVTPHFRSLGTKIRFAFYETVPGYSVSGLTFYNASAASGTTPTGATATLYAASAIYPAAGQEGAMSITFPTVGETNYTNAATDYNKAHVSYALASGGTSTADVTIGALNYQTAPELGEANAKYLGRSSATATYALPAGSTAPTTEGANAAYYEVILPYEAGAQLNLKVDYTLTSTDGSGETIKVSGATAVVPQVYTRWMPNYAYTYIFKISQNTNGLTDPSQTAAGLYPITFDAVVTETTDGVQETVTTVSDPSITTYAKGVNPSTGSEYATNSNIYVMVDNGVALTVGTNAKLYTVELASGAAQTINEQSVKNALTNGKKYTYTVVTTGATLASGTTYYKADHVTAVAGDGSTQAGENEYYTRAENASGTEWVVKDANNKEMVVTASSLLQDATQIDAADAPNGNAVAINGAKFTPTVAGTYAFQYVVAAQDAVLYANANEYNTANSTTLTDAEFEALNDAQKTKTPAVAAQNQIKIIIVH